jgi:hypothetical protein
MPKLSIDAFRASRQAYTREDSGNREHLWVYWLGMPIDADTINIEETLHIAKRTNDVHYLQIANIIHDGPLPELEELLYEWALEEGHLEENVK